MNLAQKPLLCKNILMVDGYSSTGKGLLSHFLETFENTSKVYVDHIFSEVAFMSFFKKIDKNFAKNFLDMKVDTFFENDFLSREVNFRPFDDSSIFKSSKHFKYFINLFMNDGDHIFKSKNLDKRLLLMNHFSTPFYHIYDEFFNTRLKYFEIVKHPLFIIEHWVGLFNSLKNENPRMNNFLFSKNGNKYFWFEGSKVNKDYSTLERVLYSICYLEVLNKKKISKNNYLKIIFEDFVMNTKDYISKIENFLEIPHTDKTKKFIKKFDLDTKKFVIRKGVRTYLGWKSKNIHFDSKKHREFLFNIKNNVNKNLFEEFLEICSAYEKNNNLEFLNSKNVI